MQSTRNSSTNEWLPSSLTGAIILPAVLPEQKKSIAPRSFNINNSLPNSFKVSGHLGYYFSMVKLSLEFLVAKLPTASSSLNIWHVRLPSMLSATFSIWIQMLLFSAALLLLWSALWVLEYVSTHSPNFFIKNSSHATCKYSL